MSVTTFLQIDLQSLFGFQDRRKKLDFEKIYDHFSNRETEYMIGSCIYSIKSPEFDSTRFEAKIRAIGYELKVKNSAKSTGYIKDRVSHIVPITIDCMSRMSRFEKLILISNNTNGLLDLCKYLKSEGKKIELWSFMDNYDPVMEPFVDRHFIEDDFCLKESNISIFSANDGPDSFEPEERTIL